MLAYSQGIFPWPHRDLPLLWFSPDPRFVLRFDRVHIGRSLRKRLKSQPYEVRVDTAFERVIDACASAPRPGSGRHLDHRRDPPRLLRAAPARPRAQHRDLPRRRAGRRPLRRGARQELLRRVDVLARRRRLEDRHGRAARQPVRAGAFTSSTARSTPTTWPGSAPKPGRAARFSRRCAARSRSPRCAARGASRSRPCNRSRSWTRHLLTRRRADPGYRPRKRRVSHGWRRQGTRAIRRDGGSSILCDPGLGSGASLVVLGPA